MASVNRVTILGNLGRDPEMRSFPSGGRVANLSIATTDRWKDKQSGEMKEHTEWHRVVCMDRLAEIADEYLEKGSQVYIEGSLRTRKWTDQQGVEKYSTEIRCDRLQMLGSRPERQERPARTDQRSHGTTRAQNARPNSGFDDMDDDIPF